MTQSAMPRSVLLRSTSRTWQNVWPPPGWVFRRSASVALGRDESGTRRGERSCADASFADENFTFLFRSCLGT